MARHEHLGPRHSGVPSSTRAAGGWRRARHRGAGADPTTLLGVDEIVREERLETVDFLKVDVDGPDLDVIESAGEMLADRQVLGVAAEVNWFGSANPSEPTFHNTDRFRAGLHAVRGHRSPLLAHRPARAVPA